MKQFTFPVIHGKDSQLARTTDMQMTPARESGSQSIHSHVFLYINDIDVYQVSLFSTVVQFQRLFHSQESVTEGCVTCAVGTI